MASYAHKLGVWWLKRDFRLADNEALHTALASCEQLLVVYIMEPQLFDFPDWSALHYRMLRPALLELHDQLQAYGGQVHVLEGEVLTCLANLKQETGFSALFSHEETGLAHTFKRDLAVKAWCKEQCINWGESPCNGVIRGLRDRDERAKLWDRRVVQHAPLAEPELHPGRFKAYHTMPIDSILTSYDQRWPAAQGPLQPCSETAGWDILNSFLETRSKGYSAGISSMNSAVRTGSRLSVHLAWGTLSIRQAMHALFGRMRALKEQQPKPTGHLRSLRAFCSRLHWHDHFVQRLESDTSLEFHAMHPLYERLQYPKWRQSRWDALATGQTGFPLVDACMRHYAATGFLNFRMRAMLTSFACHVLHLPWNGILYPMARFMADYVPGIHVAQTQMQAGVTGINTVRVYSPIKQQLDQDPECSFIKAWVPELIPYSPKQIAGHHESPLLGYQIPIVDYKEQVKIAKAELWGLKRHPDKRAVDAEVLRRHGSRR